MNNLTHHDDPTLIALTLTGNTTAYEALVIKHQKAVLAAAIAAIGNRFLAEDAAQDAFVSAWMKLNLLRDHTKYRSWVCRIASNCAKNLAMRYRETISLDDLWESELAAVDAVEDAILAEEECKALRDSIRLLPEKVKQVIEMHYFEGLSIAEIAYRLNMAEGTVKWQLHRGRLVLRKDLGVMNEKANDTLVERVMKKVEQLKLWRLKNDKTGFEEVYNDVLKEVEALPESDADTLQKKNSALAEVLVRGYWWLPSDKNDEMITKIKQAAIAGQNEQVLKTIAFKEHDKLSGRDKIEYMLTKQLPYYEELGFKTVQAYIFFWAGREYLRLVRFKDNAEDRAKGYDCFERVLTLVPPTDEYYANAISALRAEKLIEGKVIRDYSFCAVGEQYRMLDGKLCNWSQPGYSDGYMNSPEVWGTGYVWIFAAQCDGVMFDLSMKVGDMMTSSDKMTTLTFAEEGIVIDTLCGRFEDCELWITSEPNRGRTTKTYFKDGVGIVRSELSDACRTDYRELVNYKINGGSGKLPVAVGNHWEYKGNLKPAVFDHGTVIEITGVTEDSFTAWNEHHCIRVSIDENDFYDLMTYARESYIDYDDENSGQLRDVRPQLARAVEIAPTKLDKLHAETALDMIDTMLTTDSDFTPGCRHTGHWNFFNYNTVSCADGIISISDNRTYSFEAKNMPGINRAHSAYPLFYNDIYGILNDAVNCIWSDEWFDGFSCDIEKKYYSHANLKTSLKVNSCGNITTAAGSFCDCIKLSLQVDGYTGGWTYRGGRMEYYFAPTVGIIKADHYYMNGDEERCAVYELASYSGTGDGYMPMENGFIRRFDCVGLKDGFIANATYSCAKNSDGQLILLASKKGLGTRRE
ncbi:MAG: RNA polymerase sigma factor [Clostridia bacterium]|nr:RNA polymerase sigma factor [Clostridia bacterium]